MRFSKEQVAKALAHLESQWPNQQCELCGNNNWNVSNIVFHLQEFDKLGFWAGGEAMPLFSINCNRCFNTKLFNAIGLGIFEADPPKPSSPEIAGGKTNG